MSEPKDGGPRQRASQPVAERIHARLDKSGECWLWLGGKISAGYGEISIKGKMFLVHRISWELENGPIPQGLEIDHRCHVPACARPDHLRLATRRHQNENMSGAKRTNKVGVRGVSRQRLSAGGRYFARVDGRYLGSFDTVEDAGAAALAERLRVMDYSDGR